MDSVTVPRVIGSIIYSALTEEGENKDCFEVDCQLVMSVWKWSPCFSFVAFVLMDFQFLLSMLLALATKEIADLESDLVFKMCLGKLISGISMLVSQLGLGF